MIQRIKQLFSISVTSSTFILLLGILTIIPFILLSFYNHPSIDDFGVSAKTINLGFWKAQITWYMLWSGRYFANALIGLDPLVIHNLVLYRFIPPFLFVVLLLSLYHLGNKVFTGLNKRGILTLSILFFILFFYNMPDVAEGYYWFTGSVTYQFANILALFLLGFIIQLFETNRTKYLLASIVLTFMIIGSTETSMIYIDSILGIIFLFTSIQHKKIQYKLGILLICAGIFSFISITAPGNSVRSSTYMQISSEKIFFTIHHVLMTSFYFITLWLPIIILLLLLFFDFIKDQITETNNAIFSINPFFAFLISFGLVLLGFIPCVWTMGNSPSRTVNTIYFFFLLSFLYFSFVLFFYCKKKGLPFLSFSIPVKYVLFGLIIIIAISQKNNIKTGYFDLLSREAYNYDKELKNRYIKIAQTVEDTCYVSKLNYYPQTLFVDDITTDSKDWRNRDYNMYWKTKPIVIK
jgi:hypothetical protein